MNFHENTSSSFLDVNKRLTGQSYWLWVTSGLV